MSNPIEKFFDNRRSNPFRELSRIQNSFDRLLNEMTVGKGAEAAMDLGFSPSCEITSDGQNYILKFDMPGVTRDQVRVETDGDQLTVFAERKEEKKSETKKKYLSEVYYGSYMRSFTMPGTFDEKKVDAKFENGVLTVTVPQGEGNGKKKLIPVH
jgi:HSP20 family protein